MLYCGSTALKTEFTLYGKNTKSGQFYDKMKSVYRYYINTYCDGYNHDCLDIA